MNDAKMLWTKHVSMMFEDNGKKNETLVQNPKYTIEMPRT